MVFNCFMHCRDCGTEVDLIEPLEVETVGVCDRGRWTGKMKCLLYELKEN